MTWKMTYESQEGIHVVVPRFQHLLISTLWLGGVCSPNFVLVLQVISSIIGRQLIDSDYHSCQCEKLHSENRTYEETKCHRHLVYSLISEFKHIGFKDSPFSFWEDSTWASRSSVAILAMLVLGRPSSAYFGLHLSPCRRYSPRVDLESRERGEPYIFLYFISEEYFLPTSSAINVISSAWYVFSA